MRVALFVTCLGDTLLPDAAQSTVAVLDRLGHRVDFPDDQTCCGQMHANSGSTSSWSTPVARGHWPAGLVPGRWAASLAHRAARWLGSQPRSSRTAKHDVLQLVVPTRPEQRSNSARMSSAREAVLDALRGTLADRPSSQTFQRRYRGVVPVEDSQVANRFAARVQEHAAVVHSLAEAEIVVTVSAIGRAHDASRIVAAPGLPRPWLRSDLEVTWDDGMLARELDALGGALSGCVVAIADTGTIVVNHGTRQGRGAITLLPDLYICVVTMGQIVPTVHEGPVRLDAERPLAFISGPSATSDTELQRVDGVHGPRRLGISLALSPVNS